MKLFVGKYLDYRGIWCDSTSVIGQPRRSCLWVSTWSTGVYGVILHLL